MATFTSSMQQRHQWAVSMCRHCRVLECGKFERRTLAQLLNQLYCNGHISKQLMQDTLVEPTVQPIQEMILVLPSAKPMYQASAAQITVEYPVQYDEAPITPIALILEEEWHQPIGEQQDEHIHEYEAHRYELVCEYKRKKLSGYGLCHNWKYGTLLHKLSVCNR